MTTTFPDDAVKEFATDSRSGVLALTHGPNPDDLAVLEAMDSDAFYVGALGSMKNNDLRRKRLRDLGSTEAKVARLHGPIGLAIGSKTPAEISVSILAEITVVRNKYRDYALEV